MFVGVNIFHALDPRVASYSYYTPICCNILQHSYKLYIAYMQ